VTHDVSKFTEEQLKRFDSYILDNAFFYRFSDGTSKFCFWPPEDPKNFEPKLNYQ